MRDRLVNLEYYSYNDFGRELSNEFKKLIQNFVHTALDKYDLNDVECILTQELSCTCGEYRMINSAKVIKEKRTNK